MSKFVRKNRTKNSITKLKANYLPTFVFFLACNSVAIAQERTATVVTTPAREAPLYRNLPLAGTITSAEVANISVATSGLVASVLVEDGDFVSSDQLILQLDVGLVQQSVNSAAAQVRQAESAYRDAQRRLSEARSLVENKNISQSMLRSIEAEVEQDKATMQQLQADARYQRELLKRHSVKAPFEGVVSNKSSEKGEWVQAGQSVLTLVNKRKLRIDFSVSEEYLSTVKRSPTIRYTVSSMPNEEFESKTITIVPVADPSSRTFLMRVPIKSESKSLATGMSVSATLKVPADRTGVVVPRDAVQRYPDGRMIVWTVDDKGDHPIAIENIIQAGMSFDGQIEVIEGINESQSVIVRGNEALRPNLRVSIQPAL